MKLTPSQVFDFQVNLWLSRLRVDLTEDLDPARLNWNDGHPETLAALREFDRAVAKINEVTERHLEGVDRDLAPEA